MTTRGFTGKRPARPIAQRLPPGQYQTDDFPVLSMGPTPEVDTSAWRFTLHNGPHPLASFTWDEFEALPQTHWRGDIHCVTKWSKFDTEWSGVGIDDLFAAANVTPPTAYLLAHSFDEYDTNVPLADLVGGRAMIATRYRARRSPPSTAAPRGCWSPISTSGRVRSGCAGCASRRRTTGGFWELRGYHMYGDPWREQRYTDDDMSLAAMRRAGTRPPIERIVVQTPRVKSFFLRADRRHVAGQHLDVRLTAEDGYHAQRAIPLRRRPAPCIELAIEELAEGEVSPYFHEVAQPGDTFEVRGPLGGHFVWNASDGGPCCSWAAGRASRRLCRCFASATARRATCRCCSCIRRAPGKT